MILDATAGNRHLWGENKYPQGVVFMDKEPNLRIPADIVATWDKIPYPDNYFGCVIFDPPHQTAGNNLSCRWSKDPSEQNGMVWYGAFKNDRVMKLEIYKAQREFARLSSRLCFKWCSDDRFGSKNIDRILNLFTEWVPIFRQSINKTKTSTTYWVKMVRKPSS